MKNLIIIALILVGVPTFAQVVEFDKADVETLRQLQLQLSNGKTMTAKQLKQFERINTHVETTAKLPINTLENDVLIAFADRLFWEYQNYKRSEENAKKFIWILKRLYRTDPLVLDKLTSSYLSDEQKKELLNEIK
jgi:negative regulator of replication initiation